MRTRDVITPGSSIFREADGEALDDLFKAVLRVVALNHNWRELAVKRYRQTLD